MSHTLVYKSKTKQGNVAMMAKFAEKGMWNAKKKRFDVTAVHNTQPVRQKLIVNSPVSN